MRQNHLQTAIKVMSGGPEELVHSLVEGSLEFAILYTPQSRPGLEIELLAVEELILVQSRSVEEHPHFDGRLGRGYIYVEWSHEFALSHRAAFPDVEHPGLVIDMGMLAYQHLLEAGGSAYFPASLVGEKLESGELERCVGTPTFTLPIYAMYPPNIEAERLDAIKSELHSVLSS
jgi:DNA-binding transcriptional LysR family regulator